MRTILHPRLRLVKVLNLKVGKRHSIISPDHSLKAKAADQEVCCFDSTGCGTRTHTLLGTRF